MSELTLFYCVAAIREFYLIRVAHNDMMMIVIFIFIYLLVAVFVVVVVVDGCCVGW